MVIMSELDKVNSAGTKQVILRLALVILCFSAGQISHLHIIPSFELKEGKGSACLNGAFPHVSRLSMNRWRVSHNVYWIILNTILLWLHSKASLE